MSLVLDIRWSWISSFHGEWPQASLAVSQLEAIRVYRGPWIRRGSDKAAVIWVGSWIRGSAQRHSTAAGVRIQRIEIGVQRMNYRVRQLLRRTKRKIVRRSLLQRNIAEHLLLDPILSPHASQATRRLHPAQDGNRFSTSP